ncbi:MAG: hypothetical protein PQJ61_00465 [Spirochaetales bacterium]|uniref:Uncharacterized protein n=1 Tax=Candidatus Thalassospirochaeta sargassi TaxID=3119039 RepID=A0AAJ1IFD3_9SPIO|nr:hypothetical protein [Spirochaetales bacterium]
MFRNEKVKARGMVTVRVLDEHGKIKRKDPGILRKALWIPGRPLIQKKHNIITNQGDALLADWLLTAPTKTKITNTTGRIAVGTGWTGVSTKANTGCNNQVGTRRAMDTGYPQTKGAFDAADDNVIIYRATFPAGSLNTNGIDEAALMNAATNGECLAYAQITPEVNITSNDTLQIEWEITFLGT